MCSTGLFLLDKWEHINTCLSAAQIPGLLFFVSSTLKTDVLHEVFCLTSLDLVSNVRESGGYSFSPFPVHEYGWRVNSLCPQRGSAEFSFWLYRYWHQPWLDFCLLNWSAPIIADILLVGSFFFIIFRRYSHFLWQKRQTCTVLAKFIFLGLMLQVEASKPMCGCYDGIRQYCKIHDVAQHDTGDNTRTPPAPSL